MVANSALYNAPNLALMVNLKWLCRVPLTIKEAKELVSTISEEPLINSEIEGYKLAVHKSHYGGIEQRWLVVESTKEVKAAMYRKIYLSSSSR
jgi:transposase